MIAAVKIINNNIKCRIIEMTTMMISSLTRPYLKTIKGGFVELHQDNENGGSNGNNDVGDDDDDDDLDRLMRKKNKPFGHRIGMILPQRIKA